MWVINMPGTFFQIMLSMGVCTASHCQASSRLVQELSVFTVCALQMYMVQKCLSETRILNRSGTLTMPTENTLWSQEGMLFGSSGKSVNFWRRQAINRKRCMPFQNRRTRKEKSIPLLMTRLPKWYLIV